MRKGDERGVFVINGVFYDGGNFFFESKEWAIMVCLSVTLSKIFQNY